MRPLRSSWLLPTCLLGALLLGSCSDDPGWELDWIGRADLLTLRPETTRLLLTDQNRPWLAHGLTRFDQDGCWSLGDETSLRPVFLRPGDRTLFLRAYRPPFLTDLAVGLEVNGTPLPPWTPGPGWHDYRLELPARVLRQGRNRIRLRYSRIYRPSELDPRTMDGRALAIRYREILFVPPGGQPDPMAYPAGHQKESPGVAGRMLSAPVLLEAEVLAPPQARLELELESQAAVGLTVALVLDGRVMEEATLEPRARWRSTLELPAGRDGLSRFEIRLVPRGPGEASVLLRRARLSAPQAPVGAARNLVLLTLDTLRADRLGCYGQPGVRTPFLDRLARRGVQFTRAYSHSPITGPAHSAIFTGRYPRDVGVVCNAQALPAGSMTLARLLRASGFRTAAFVSAAVLGRGFGYQQGFSTFQESGRAGFARAPETHEALGEYLKNHPAPEIPTFLWLHYYDPHMPYSPPGIQGDPAVLTRAGEELARWSLADGGYHKAEFQVPPGITELTLSTGTGRGLQLRSLGVAPPELTLEWSDGWEFQDTLLWGELWRVRDGATLKLRNPTDRPMTARLNAIGYDDPGPEELRRRYAGEVEHLDRWLEKAWVALAEAGLLDGSLLVVTADHGESLGEHELFGHIHQVYEPLARVPLLMAGQIPRTGLIDRPARHLDLAATLLSGLGISAEPLGSRGLDLLKPAAGLGDLPIYCETSALEAREEIRSIRLGDRHLLFHPSRAQPIELYDLEADPGELRPLPLDPAVVEPLMGALEAEAPRGEAGPAPALSPEAEQTLRALGYL